MYLFHIYDNVEYKGNIVQIQLKNAQAVEIQRHFLQTFIENVKAPTTILLNIGHFSLVNVIVIIYCNSSTIYLFLTQV